MEQSRVPGWYEDPDDPSRLRYWDEGWTHRSATVELDPEPEVETRDDSFRYRQLGDAASVAVGRGWSAIRRHPALAFITAGSLIAGAFLIYARLGTDEATRCADMALAADIALAVPQTHGAPPDIREPLADLDAWPDTIRQSTAAFWTNFDEHRVSLTPGFNYYRDTLSPGWVAWASTTKNRILLETDCASEV